MLVPGLKCATLTPKHDPLRTGLEGAALELETLQQPAGPVLLMGGGGWSALCGGREEQSKLFRVNLNLLSRVFC